MTALGHSTAAINAGTVGCPSKWCTHTLHGHGGMPLTNHLEAMTRTRSPQRKPGTCNWPSPARYATATTTLLERRRHQGFGPTKPDESWPPIPAPRAQSLRDREEVVRVPPSPASSN